MTTERTVALVLRLGSYSSAVLLGVGLLLALMKPSAALHYSLGEMIRRMVSGDPAAVMQAGILLLLVTPVLRVAAAALSLARERDFTYAAISVAVLLIVLSSILVRLAT
jgi:uncharacterized membrane protein